MYRFGNRFWWLYIQWFSTTFTHSILMVSWHKSHFSEHLADTFNFIFGVLGWLLVVVLSAPIRGGSLGICSVCWMLCTALYGSTSLQQLPFLLLLCGLSYPRIAELGEMPRSFSIKLHSETQVSSRLGMSVGRSSRHAQNPLSGERRKTLSITRHALPPPPSHHHLYIIHLINWLQRFYRITM